MKSKMPFSLENELPESGRRSRRAPSWRAASTEESESGESAEAAEAAGRGLRLVRNAAVHFAPGLGGARGTMGATLGQPGGKKRKSAGSSSQGEGQLSRCPREGRSEGEHHGRSHGTGVSGYRRPRSSVHRTESTGSESDSGPVWLLV